MKNQVTFLTAFLIFSGIEIANGQTLLLSNLEDPRALWVKGDNVFLTETAGRNTIWGGNLTLIRYRISSGQATLMVNEPENSDALVVSSDGLIYLTSYYNIIPGQQGKVSFVDTTTLLETHLMDIAIASRDMFIDDNGNILIIGMSDFPTANSLYYLPAGNYTNPDVLQTGLGRVWCVSMKDDITFFSDLSSTFYFANNGIIDTFLNKSVMSITFSPHYLFYADIFGGTIGKINLETHADSVILTGLNYPINVRYVAATNSLYFLEAGSEGAEFKDGTLQVLENADHHITNVNSLVGTKNPVQVYPNPASDQVNFQFTKPTSASAIITSMIGDRIVEKILCNATSVKFEIKDFPAGIYFLSITDENINVVTKKFVKM